MPFFRRADYQSDTTQFIAEMREQRPHLEASQRQGRALLWDRTLDREVWGEYRAAQVPQQAYVYQTKSV
jgi:hypothetical protein